MHPHFPDDHGDGRVGGPFHSQKSIHKLLGGGKVADVLLWKDRNLSAGVLLGATLIWYLFEVVEYNIIPLLCQIAILAMLVIFIWSNAAPLLNMYEFLFLQRTSQLIENSTMAQGTRSRNSTNQFCIAEHLQESRKSSSPSMPSDK